MPEARAKHRDVASLDAEARKAGLEIPEDRLPQVLATADWLRDCVAALRNFVASRDLL